MKPNYWASIPFMWTFLVWRTRSFRRGVALTAVMLAVPAVFFASDRTHLKLLAYVPVLRDWVSALGYYPWHTLIEDMERLGSDYATVSWGTSYRDQLVGIPSAVGLYLKRYAVWLVALASLVSLAAWRARRNPAAVPRLLEPAGLRFAFVLYWYLLATQFVVLGPLRKHAFAYMGAVAPLLAIAIGCVFARMWERLPPSTFGRRAVVAALVIALACRPGSTATTICPVSSPCRPLRFRPCSGRPSGWPPSSPPGRPACSRWRIPSPSIWRDDGPTCASSTSTGSSSPPYAIRRAPAGPVSGGQSTWRSGSAPMPGTR